MEKDPEHPKVSRALFTICLCFPRQIEQNFHIFCSIITIGITRGFAPPYCVHYTLGAAVSALDKLPLLRTGDDVIHSFFQLASFFLSHSAQLVQPYQRVTHLFLDAENACL